MTNLHDLEPADEPAYGNQLKITMNTPPRYVVAWLEHHGHRGWYLGLGRAGVDSAPVLTFDHGPGTPTFTVVPGDTLTVRPNGTITVT